MCGNKGSARHEFEWLGLVAPEFAVDGNKIQILDTPTGFHSKLVQEAQNVKRRVVLATLYLGTGSLEKELLDAVRKVAANNGNDIEITILMDFVRGSRGESNSVEMLKPLLHQYGESERLKISLYHTPNLRGLLRKLLPPRYNETLGVAHLKAFIFDDNFIISGANLSHDYFCDRQDRYMAIHDCPHLANYFQGIVETISQFSFRLLPNESIEMPPGWSRHPYEGSLQDFTSSAQKSVMRFIRSFLPSDVTNAYDIRDENMRYEKKGMAWNLCAHALSLLKSVIPYYSDLKAELRDPEKFFSETLKKPQCLDPPSSSSGDKDTWIYPTIQMGLFGIRQDEYVTASLLRSFPAGSEISFTTGYFNVTDKYCDIMIGSKANYEILLSSPEANGFFESRGFGKHIPQVYIHLCKKFYEKVANAGRTPEFSLMEYTRQGWTFHGKGMWCYLPGEKFPNLTLIGSSNFGLRSVNRDLEAQIAVVTNNETLRKKLHAERLGLTKHAVPVTADTFSNSRYFVPRMVAFVSHFIKRFF